MLDRRPINYFDWRLGDRRQMTDMKLVDHYSMINYTDDDSSIFNVSV